VDYQTVTKKQLLTYFEKFKNYDEIKNKLDIVPKWKEKAVDVPLGLVMGSSISTQFVLKGGSRDPYYVKYLKYKLKYLDLMKHEN